MQGTPKSEKKNWFVLNFINFGQPSPRKHIDSFNTEGHSVELFAPTIRPAKIVKGKVEYREQLLTYSYVFVRGTLNEVKELCMRPGNNLSMMVDRSSEKRYAIISDQDMANFKIIARAHANMIPFFNIEDVELKEGDLVEVVDGQYAGLKGTFMPKSRSNKGNLVIAATAAMGAMVWDIDAKCIRILEFARDTRRQYDLVDSFIPKLFPILRKFHADEPLTNREKSQLCVFSRRMGIVSCANNKAEAKLLAVLISVQTILGDLDSLRYTRQRFEKRKDALTNPWTLALTELIMSVAQNDTPRLKKAYESVSSLSDKLTETQSKLLEEYRYYIN